MKSLPLNVKETKHIIDWACHFIETRSDFTDSMNDLIKEVEGLYSHEELYPKEPLPPSCSICDVLLRPLEEMCCWECPKCKRRYGDCD